MGQSNGRKVYVVGGYYPRGGTYMAYHIGRILHRRFGYQCIVVRLQAENYDTGFFRYPDHFDLVGFNFMVKNIVEEDILIANPSFSNLLLGPRLPGTKLMYIQDWKTYSVLDGFFDHYVSVSGFVQQFVKETYGIDTSVIPAFIETEKIPFQRPWRQRPPERIVFSGKHFFPNLLNQFNKVMRSNYPDIKYQVVALDKPMPHERVFEVMSQSRYFVTLSPVEGFGLQPLEAMACGCTVLGFHGCGGMHYMTPGVNCQVTNYPRIDDVVDQVATIFRDPSLAEQLAAQACIDAREYGYQAYEHRWTEYFIRTVGLEPVTQAA